MALQGEMTLPNGITLPAGYLKIERVIDDRSVHAQPHVSIESSIYASAEARQAEMVPVDNALHTCAISMVDPETSTPVPDPTYAQFFSLTALEVAGANLIANGYLYLKTLPAFASLADC